jgi:LmbE family N-acetylglucosaminyl deacetylase
VNEGDTVTTVLVTVAHPDDEAFGLGSLLADAAARGARTVVACATRGELGEPAPGTALLGVERVELLGWRDSGVDGEPDRGSLAAAATGDVVAAIASLVDEIRPDVVVTLDASDGHRDHAIVRDATIAALSTSSHQPVRTYLWCLPRSLMHRFTGDSALGTPDAEITHLIDTSVHLDLRWRAMRAHASQQPPYDSMDADLQLAFLTTDRLRQIEPPWPGGGPATSWLPG